ncbi:MAG TPA: uracil-DNA glycosylase [Candidatus Krumholzibacteria bacterium]|nr:uracil-DNA glycosylase [Candidatus Krumholzibacteria bacterium]
MSDPRFENIASDLRTWLAQQQSTGKERVHVDWERVKQIQQGAKALRRESGSVARKVDSTEASAQAEALRVLAQEVAGCVKCKLHSTRTQTVFGVGNPNADLVFVGEAPGRDEDLQGEPFVGMAGKLLTKIISAIGFEREDVYICNVLKCRPPQNRDPQPDEVAQCEPYLLRQLEILQPKVICALGRVAAQTLLQTRESLTRMRGRVHDYHGIPMMVTYHPAALLRNPNWKRPTWEDVQKLRALHDELVGGED